VQRFHLDLTDLRRAYLHEALSVAQPFDGWKGFFSTAQSRSMAKSLEYYWMLASWPSSADFLSPLRRRDRFDHDRLVLGSLCKGDALDHGFEKFSAMSGRCSNNALETMAD
jgi:hypothetical protein